MRPRIIRTARAVTYAHAQLVRKGGVLAMASASGEVCRVREFLRRRLLGRNEGGDVSVDPPPSARQAVRYSEMLAAHATKDSSCFRILTDLLDSTVCESKGNSILLIGPRGVGKSWVGVLRFCLEVWLLGHVTHVQVVEQALGSLVTSRSADNFITVHLNGEVTLVVVTMSHMSYEGVLVPLLYVI